jgi:hypothetical protein
MSIAHIVAKFDGLQNEEYQGHFYLNITPDPGPNDIVEVSVNITDYLQDMYDNLVSAVRTAITAVEYTVYLIDLVNEVENFYFDGGWTFTGAVSGDQATSPQIAPTITAPVLGGRRPGQKRMIPITENNVNEGILSVNATAALDLFAGVWTGTRPASASFSYQTGILSRVSPWEFRPFTGAFFTRAVVGTVGSRKLGVGI